ncbi:hypothetical protein SY83_05595 [Paenibacillus swuensis]|uniref:Uncharacterized protein n=1 Tax=Paenibacillus swuensis TaxID=1178515 RepID=A0A172TFM6_9BACL|nr:hypothetical protein [Paenibacillus swuensis]ANE45865.1 hypothetical protein SY83_05595 [Paenibacillus swuensis]
MKKILIFISFLIFAGYLRVGDIDLSGQELYGYQPNTPFGKERAYSIVEEENIGTNLSLRYEDGIRFIVSPDNIILSIETRSEMKPFESRDGIRQGDSVDKVINKLGKKYSTLIEQGAKIYTYQDSKNQLIQEFWTVDGKVQIIRLKRKD